MNRRVFDGVTGLLVVELTLLSCLPKANFQPFSLAWKKADIFKINGSDDTVLCAMISRDSTRT